MTPWGQVDQFGSPSDKQKNGPESAGNKERTVVFTWKRTLKENVKRKDRQEKRAQKMALVSDSDSSDSPSSVWKLDDSSPSSWKPDNSNGSCGGSCVVWLLGNPMGQVVVWLLGNQVDLVGVVLEGEVFLITIRRPLQKHSATSLMKRLPWLMPQELRNLCSLTMVMGLQVLFMGHQMDMLQEHVVCVPGETSARPLTSVLVARGPFTVVFVPNGVWKVVKCGVFFARNQIRNLQIQKKTWIRKIAVVKGFVDR